MAHFLGATAIVLVFLAAINHYLKPDKPHKEPPPDTYLVACFSAGKIIFSGESVGPSRVGPTGKILFYSSDIGAEVRMVNATCVEMIKK